MENMGKVEHPLDDEEDEKRALQEYFTRRKKNLPPLKSKFEMINTTLAIVKKIMDEGRY